MYENRMKPVEVVLRGGRIRENDEEVNLLRIYCKHICKCHYVPPRRPVQLLFANKTFQLVYICICVHTQCM
jgi:hypothetical protein